jgi:hypothetical protein
MVRKITQQNQVGRREQRMRSPALFRFSGSRPYSTRFYLVPRVLTEILRLGRFGSGAGDDRYGTIATAMTHSANARDIQATEHSDARGRHIYGQTT